MDRKNRMDVPVINICHYCNKECGKYKQHLSCLFEFSIKQNPEAWARVAKAWEILHAGFKNRVGNNKDV